MYGPTVPATGGGLFAISGLIYGGYTLNYIVLFISIALLVVIGMAVYRLRTGEKSIAKRDN